jgi:hypothetical protein
VNGSGRHSRNECLTYGTHAGCARLPDRKVFKSITKAKEFGQEVGMNPTAYFHHPRRVRAHDDVHEDEGTVGALVIAILFALFAAISFAVDLSLSLPE